MTVAELKKMTVKQLREYAAEHTELTGLSGMKKEQLVETLIEALGLETKKKVTGDALKDKKSSKNEILRLKQKKEELLASAKKNAQQLKNIRRRIRNLKRNMRTIA